MAITKKKNFAVISIISVSLRMNNLQNSTSLRRKQSGKTGREKRFSDRLENIWQRLELSLFNATVVARLFFHLGRKAV